MFSFFYVVTGSYAEIWHITDYRNEIFAVTSFISIFASDTSYLIYIITDHLGEIQIFRKGHRVLIKYHYLIQAMGSYAEVLNRVQ
jgi:hypothetical protein